MSKIVDRIIESQTLVRQAESKEIPWEKAFRVAFDQGPLDPSDLYAFVAGVYFRLRITEAGAYHFRQGNEGYPHGGVQNLISTCRMQKADIIEALRNSESFKTSSPLEEVAKLWVEEKLRWALAILDDSIPAWGY